MRASTKSPLSFAWVMSLFGVEQLATILTQNVSGSQEKATGAFDAVTQATIDQFGTVIQGLFQAGDELQREAVDVLFSVLSPTGLVRLPGDMLQWSTQALRCFLPSEGSLLLWQELQNKVEVFFLVPGASTLLGLPSEPPFPPVQTGVERAYALEPYPIVWAVEGLGYWYGNTFWQRHETPHRILRSERVGDLPTKSLLMLHAGIGLSFAQHYLQRVNHLSPVADIRQALEQIITLCLDNSRPGYEGPALESLGLVTRSGTFTGDARPEVLVQIVGQQLARIAPEVAGYFWHGVGRASYFLPINFVPCYGSFWHAFEMVRQEALDESAWLSALAGLAWVLGMVNIRQPAIVANVLKYHGAQLAENDAFAYGIATSTVMRYDTTPDAPFIGPFYQYQPDPAQPGLVQLWNSQVSQPTREALHDYYPVLKEYDCLGEIFRYQSLPALVSRLESDSRAATSLSDV